MSNIRESIFEIQNSLGIHARPAAMFVQLASEFDSDISVEKEGEVVDGKSLMGLLMLSAGMGTQIKIIADGLDSEDAINALSDLINVRKFDEE